jgi:hypothetical protein
LGEIRALPLTPAFKPVRSSYRDLKLFQQLSFGFTRA